MSENVIDKDEVFVRRAPQGGASSWNAKDRTFRAIIAAGAPVVRRDWDGEYIELLDPAGVELPAHVPLLNAHRTRQVSDVVGVVQKVERIADRLEAVLRLSSRADVENVAMDVRDGVLSGVSIGYVVLSWAEATDDTGRRTKTATSWRLLEVSIVPIPADDAARIRSKAVPTTNDDATDDTEPTVTKPRSKRVARAATELEIRGLAQVARLPEDFIAEQIEAGATMREVRAAAIDYLAERQEREQPRSGMHLIGLDPYVVGGNLSNPAIRANAMAEAIAVRAMPDLTLSPEARQFIGLSLVELARENLRLSGADVRGLGASQIVTRSLGGLHSTSDFANALSGAVGLVLRNAYEASPSGLKPLARRVTLSDFRAKTFVNLSGFSALEKVNEHGEFKRGTLEDGGEHVKLDTFGKIFGITRQAIINDDVGMISDLPRRLGQAASQFEAAQLAELLLKNPVMADGKALFHADHGNLAAAGAAPSEATLSAARLALRTQTDAVGQLIGIAPRFLVVGPELETGAEKLMSAITPAATGDAQPIKLSVAVEPRIAGKAWFIAADPAACDGLVYAHLASEPGPQIEHRVGFNVDGVEFKVRLDFGAAFIDHRSWYRNPGAA